MPYDMGGNMQGGGGKGVPWAGLGIAGLSGLAGLFPTPTAQNTKQTGQVNTNSTGFQNNYSASDINSLLQTLSNLTTRNQTQGTTAPTLGGPQQALLDQLTRQYGHLAGANVNLAPYGAQQTRQINANANAQSEAVRNIMAARGLSTSPVSGTSEANIQANRIGQISNLLSTLPLLQQQLQQQNLGAAGGFLSSIPRGTTTASTTEGQQVGDTSQVGKTTGVNTSDTNFGQNTSQWQQQITEALQKSGGGIGGFLAGLAPILASIFL